MSTKSTITQIKQRMETNDEKLLYLQSQLDKALITTYGNTRSMLSMYKPTLSQFKQHFRHYIFTQYLEKFKIKGLEDLGLTSEFFMNMLYNYSDFCAVNRNGKWLFLPYTYTDTINEQGLHEEVEPITMGKTSVSLPKCKIYTGLNEYKEGMAILLFGRNYLPSNNRVVPSSITECFVKDIANCYKSNSNLIILSNKRIKRIIKDISQAESEKSIIQSNLEDDSPIMVATGNSEIDTVDYADLSGISYFTNAREILATIYTMLGITTKGFGTGMNDRTMSGDLKGQQLQTELVYEYEKNALTRFFDTINEVDGLVNLQLEEQVEFYEEEEQQSIENGNQRNEVEENE